jgi:RecB family exonuclease
MLTMVTYATKTGLRRFLGERLGSHVVKVVAPFPGKADALREAWSFLTGVSVDTVARFNEDLWQTVAGADAGDPPWRKSRLLLQLNAFKNLHPNLRGVDYGTFKTAYQAFSDVRAYVDTPEIPDELLTAFPPEVADLVQLFHAGTRLAGVRDEHSATFELTARLRGTGVPALPFTDVVFEGFTFLTPAQLSLVEALAIRHRVWIPLPRNVWEHGHEWDWPRFLGGDRDVVDTDEPRVGAPRLKVRLHPAGSLVPAMRAWRAETPGPVQILLGAKRADAGAWQEVPFADMPVKVPVDILAEPRDALFRILEEEVAVRGTKRPAGALLATLAEVRGRAVAARDMGAMRLFQAAALVEEALAAVPGCLEGQALNGFWLQLLREVTELDAPRNHRIALLPGDAGVTGFSLRDLDGVRTDRPVAFCVDGGYGSVKSDHRPHAPEMERALAKLGPIRRPELDFLFLRAELDELLRHPHLTVLLEDGLVKHDLSWKQVFSGVEYEAWPAATPPPRVRVPDYGFFRTPEHDLPTIDRVSASRLQDFLDCPRRYHAKRIEKLLPDVEAVAEMDVMAMGSLEHALVALAWPRGPRWWRDPANLRDEAARLLAELGRTLTPVTHAAALAEVALYAANGLESLHRVETALPGTVFRFEVPLSAPGRTGSIDCLGTGGGTVVLIDFKRSKGQNPAFPKWTDFGKVQLWFYLRALAAEGIPIDDVVAGYFFFKDPEESWLAFSRPDAHPLAEAELGPLCHAFPDFGAELTRYGAFEDEALARFTAERAFLPAPRVPEVCAYCGLRPLCPGAVEGEEP